MTCLHNIAINSTKEEPWANIKNTISSIKTSVVIYRNCSEYRRELPFTTVDKILALCITSHLASF